MKAQDLRIGNFVQPNKEHLAAFGNVNIGVVTSIGEYNFTVSNHYPGQWFEPIPLTEEWLLKFGFKPTCFQKEPHQWWNNGKLEVGYTTKDDVIQYEYLSPTITEMVDIPYLHQLQNLYFTLTGEELTLQQP